MTTRARSGWPAAMLCVALVACSQEHDRPDAPVEVDCGSVTERRVDVLWVTQTKSASSELRALAGDLLLPTLAEALDRSTTGDIRIGTTTGAVGPAGARATGAAGCSNLAEIFDGVLIPRGDGSGRIYTTSSEDLALAASNTLGLEFDGCGNSMLEAAVRALAPHDFDLPLTFAGSYHGDVENAGFTAPGDVVLVVFVTMQDDCSWNERVAAGVSVGSICPFETFSCCEEVLAPTSRYVDAFQRLEERLGVDIVLASYTAVTEPDLPLTEWRMRDMSMPTCDAPTPVVHFPWRILEVTEALAPDATSQSGCYGGGEERFRAAADAIAARVAATGCGR